MGLSYKDIFAKIRQNESDNEVTSSNVITYAANFSQLLSGRRTSALSKPLLTSWQKNLIFFCTGFSSHLLMVLTFPVPVPLLVFLPTCIVIGVVLGNLAIDLIYKAKDFPRTTLALKLFSELTLLPLLIRGIRETAKELELAPKFVPADGPQEMGIPLH